ncbi:MAG TPA: Panacea domain-containing protein [Puia sp.]|nr:Panacea domain-containing protein [Puia sp.]
MKAIKLIWLSDRLHLRNFGRTITGDTYFAFKYGPVPSSTRDILESNSSFLSEDELSYSTNYLSIISNREYSSAGAPLMKVFSETDISTIDEVVKAYGKYDQFQLSDISHEFPEWKKWEKAFTQKMGSRFLIDFEDFFKDAADEKPLFKQDLANLQLVKDLYLRVDDNSANK